MGEVGRECTKALEIERQERRRENAPTPLNIYKNTQ